MLYDPKHDLDQVGKVMYRAADLLEERGWCRNTLWNEKGEMCILGAIQTVANISDGVEKRLSRYLGVPFFNMVKWNNDICSSKEEVITLLREAATYKGE